jgi:hypothetical protein
MPGVHKFLHLTDVPPRFTSFGEKDVMDLKAILIAIYILTHISIYQILVQWKSDLILSGILLKMNCIKRNMTVKFTYRNNRIKIIGAGYWWKGKKLYKKRKKYNTPYQKMIRGYWLNIQSAIHNWEKEILHVGNRHCH